MSLGIGTAGMRPRTRSYGPRTQFGPASRGRLSGGLQGLGDLGLLEPDNAERVALNARLQVWKRMKATDLFIPPSELCRGSDAPWIKMPRNARRFDLVQTIALPSAASGDNTVITMYVPNGYNGVITGILNIYTGIGFLEGSGDLVWSIKINQYYARSYGFIITTMGALQQSRSVVGPTGNGGIRVYADEIIRYIVNAPNPVGALAGNNIVCGLTGYFYPSGEGGDAVCTVAQ